MEYGSLSSWFSENLSRKYFQQLISAVGYCHSLDVYHRDLKPENLLVDENGDLKVSDFGLSVVTNKIRPDGLFHKLCGTPSYVAPEILTKKGYDGAKVDVWSCGVILYVLNAGFLPFNDPNLMAMYILGPPAPLLEAGALLFHSSSTLSPTFYLQSRR